MSPLYLADGRDDPAAPVPAYSGHRASPGPLRPHHLTRHRPRSARQFTPARPLRWPCGRGLATPTGPPNPP